MSLKHSYITIDAPASLVAAIPGNRTSEQHALLEMDVLLEEALLM